MKAKVYLIGAGPGDPGLITVKGRACIAAADVVVRKLRPPVPQDLATAAVRVRRSR